MGQSLSRTPEGDWIVVETALPHSPNVVRSYRAEVSKHRLPVEMEVERDEIEDRAEAYDNSYRSRLRPRQGSDRLTHLLTKQVRRVRETGQLDERQVEAISKVAGQISSRLTQQAKKHRTKRTKVHPR